MLAIVVSRADSASVHIGDHLRDLADWREHSDGSRPEGDGGGTVYRLPSDADDSTNGDGPAADPAVELREFADLHLDLVDVADAFGRVDADSDRVQPDLLVFASRHAGETDELLTAHHTGNFGPADYGGEPGAFARACPNAQRRVLAALREHAPPDYEVGMECTHHGPTDVGAPSMFVEVGSAEEQWEDPAAARAVANAILDLQGVAADAPAENGDGAGDGTRRQVVGFGGRLDSARFRYVLAERFDVPVQNVEATILGEHGDAQVPVFSKVRVDGADPEFTESEREEILGDLQTSAMNVIERKGATEWGPATGVGHMVEAVLRDTGEVLPGSVTLDGEFGHDDVALGVPLKIGADGVEEVVEWDLADYEADLLDEAAEKLSDQYAQLG